MREALVRTLVALGDASTPSVIEAMRLVPRHAFVPDASLEVAYANHPALIGHDQTISQPSVVAIMTEALELGGHERVLEIGTGSGYQAAVLSLLAREVYTVERIEALATAAAMRLEALGYANVHVRAGDGFLGWPEEAPFDRILLTAAPPRVPDGLMRQLADGGILIAPVGEEDEPQALLRVRKRAGELYIEELGGVKFVAMVRGEER
jgi:protein-L-isoaspartate(D-aspartate) O-methyltransferase